MHIHQIRECTEISFFESLLALIPELFDEVQIIEHGTPDEMKQSRNPVVSQFLSGSTEGPILEGTHDAITTK